MLPFFICLLHAVAAEKFFDPTHADFKQCGFNRRSLLCDPDGVLKAADRNRLYNELQMMESRTSLRRKGEKIGNCSSAGITPAIYIVRTGGEEKTSQIGAFIRDNWNLDERCKNNLVIVLSSTETRYQVYLNSTYHPSLSQLDVVHFLKREANYIKYGNFGSALSNLLDKVILRVMTKYTKWTPSSFPNPMGSDHNKCGLKAEGALCDPDRILDAEERETILVYLETFEKLTRHSPGASSRLSALACSERGYSMGLALMRNVRGGTLDNLHDVTDNILNTWKLDEQCGKHFVMAMSLDDGLISIRAPPDSLLKTERFTEYFENNKSLVLRGEIRDALGGILENAVEDALSGKLFTVNK
ncbi:hypothetical protein PMAYCL1PPCAC_00940 [Pristionchus mayeri]|uniref:TPM domain-containing protein n=1 Tax=Pristionchus mayeri TaxID=1317129 RepID=A0AAN4Z3T5_9BILA|nr:hypothetical protein PMAYCL1PPCAC_00940 [Pristionchus mayeri]